MSRRGRTVQAITGAWRSDLLLVLAFLCGLALRLYQLTDQILAHDEWHALHALNWFDYRGILSHFGEADVSIPLTFAYKLAADTIGLSEMVMRAPVLLAGAAALVILPLLVRPHVGRSVSVVFAWLLAIAPLHVYYSRYARPYSITMLLAVVAVFAFFAWWTGGRKGWAWIYVAAAVVAPYFHLAVLPFVLAPLLFGTGHLVLLWRGAERRSFLELLAVGAGIGVGPAVLLAPPILTDLGAITGKSGKDSVSLATLGGAALLFAGTSRVWLAVVLLGVLVAIGWRALSARNRELALFLAFVSGCQLVVAALSGPAAINQPIVFARYLLPLLPLVLLGAAAAISRLDTRLGRTLRAYPRGGIAVALLALLLALGPLPLTYRYPNDWTNHALFQYGYDSGASAAYAAATSPYRISPFYRQLAAHRPGSLLITEVPWHYAWHENPFPHYQAVHRQRMQIGFVAAPDEWTAGGELPPNSTVRFRNAVHVTDLGALLEQGVRYVVFHRALGQEFPAGAWRDYTPIDVSWLVRGYRAGVGEPVYQNADLVVFELHGGLDAAAAETAVLRSAYP